jgi:hypothetical protein
MTVKRHGARARGLVAVGALVAAAAGARSAAAHPEISALGTNRYVTAAVFDGRVDVTDALLEGALASGEERARLDADGDGRLSEAEARAAEARWRAEGPAVVVEVDGRRLDAPVEVAIELGDDPRVGAEATVIDRRQTFSGAWPEGARRLTIRIAREPARLLDTEIGVVLGPGLTLASATDRATFQGPRASALEDRAATFEIAGPPRRKLAPRIAFVGAALLAIVIAAMTLRRARRS